MEMVNILELFLTMVLGLGVLYMLIRITNEQHYAKKYVPYKEVIISTVYIALVLLVISRW